jgi:hypothetical protein
MNNYVCDKAQCSIGTQKQMHKTGLTEHVPVGAEVWLAGLASGLVLPVVQSIQGSLRPVQESTVSDQASCLAECCPYECW